MTTTRDSWYMEALTDALGEHRSDVEELEFQVTYRLQVNSGTAAAAKQMAQLEADLAEARAALASCEKYVESMKKWEGGEDA
jgi:hypothetical protein